MFDDRFQRCIGARMPIGRGFGNIAQRRGAELIGVLGIAGHAHPAFIAGMAFEAGGFARANLRHGNGMKAVIGLKLSRMAGAAFRFAIKQFHPCSCI